MKMNYVMLNDILTLVLSSSVVSVIVTFIIGELKEYIKNKKNKKTTTEIELEKVITSNAEISKQVLDLHVLCKINTEANKLLLKDKIYYLADKITERGYVYQTELINFNDLFDIYKNKYHGNHIDKAVEQVNKLPIRKDTI